MPKAPYLATIDPHTVEGLPLYTRVRGILWERIRSGAWKPGQMIPSEIEIGRELGVSQGTVRKVLDAFARERLVVRRQGRGTFVVEHTSEDVLFRFFHIYRDDGSRIAPASIGTVARTGEADTAERARLSLSKSAHVIRITRLRAFAGQPFLAEKIVLPRARFPGLAEKPEIPNTLYDLFQREYGILVARADERITAVAANKWTARDLKIPEGTPLLHIDRIAYAIDDRPVEWRVSFVHLDGAHYLSRLR